MMSMFLHGVHDTQGGAGGAVFWRPSSPHACCAAAAASAARDHDGTANGHQPVRPLTDKGQGVDQALSSEQHGKTRKPACSRITSACLLACRPRMTDGVQCRGCRMEL
eukprot:1143420-Pelagomonas_calceolata.AAC.1